MLNGTTFYLIAGGITCVAAAVAIVMTGESRRLRRVRSEHLRTHRDMADSAFVGLARVSAAEEKQVCRIREEIAKVMRVPAATVHPSDDLAYIATFGFDGMDFVEIAFCVERVLAVRVADKTWDEFLQGKQCRDMAAMVHFLGDKGYLSGQQSLATG